MAFLEPFWNSYKKHYSTSAFDEAVGDESERYTRSANTMDEQDLFAVLGAKFIDADGSILG